MAWYAALLTLVWMRRAIISVDNTATPGTVDVDVVIPPDFDDFWGRIDAAGAELRVISPNSRTLAAYSVDNGSGGAFDATNRLGRVRVDAFAFGATPGVFVLWLYYGSVTAQGAASVATVIAAPNTGYIELGKPSAVRRYAYAPVRPGYTRPVQLTAKTSGENIDVWIDITPALEHRMGVANFGIFHEEAYFCVLNVYNSALVDQPLMYDATRTRWVFNQKTGRTWLRVFIQGGTSGQNYVIVPSVYTQRPGDNAGILAQKVHPYVALVVRDLSPP
jgi:hypothetical protein